jgi:RNA polymerase sigma-70 factor, ECF subfamily
MAVPPNVNVAIPVPGVLDAAPSSSSASGTTWERELVRNCQKGDPDAFRLLVERYQGRVFSIAHTLVRSRADVEDVAQQVFTKVYLRISSFDSRAALITWIYRITINECYNLLRKNKPSRWLRACEMTEAEAHQMESTPSVEPGPERRAEMSEIISYLLGRVSAEERLLLYLKEVEGFSIQDLSEMFDTNENTVKVKLFRARQRLAEVAKKRFRKIEPRARAVAE